jgi:CRISPR-associated endonuclease/helicase Cas3
MYSSIKSIEQILNETSSISSVLLNAETYYAHVPHDRSELKNPETLNEHVALVLDKFSTLSGIHQLDHVVDAMIVDLFDKNKLPFNSDIAAFIKVAWVNIIVCHDYGKVNENFQAHPDKMNNPNFKGKEKPGSPLSTHHSALGAYLYIVKHFEELSKQENTYRALLSIVCLGFSYSIFKHHGKYLGDNSKEKIAFSEDEVECMRQYIQCYRWNTTEQFSKIIPVHTGRLLTDLDRYINSFSFYSLIRLGFSLLTASDFLASGEYMTGLKVKDFGVLSRERISEIYHFASQIEWLNKKEGKKNFNKTTFEKSLLDYQYLNPNEISNSNLNALRQEMGIEVLKKIRAHSDKNLFYMEAPTGGGKTNLSFLATIELLKLNNNLNKVFYVFPFTTLVTQTQKSLIETFDLSNDEVITLSSKSGFKEKLELESEDDRYGKQKQFYLDNLFSFFPFCLLTHIKFFNILKTNEKEENYLLHRLANSVVVLDELQAYSPKEWDKVIYFIRNYAQFYNIKFIVMSATLPKLGNLNILKKHSSDFVYLIDKSQERYFQNPNFRDRVSFNLDLFDEKNLNLDDLANMLIAKSKEYSEKDFGDVKPKDSVYTIIEFIFKKSATEFYSVIAGKESFFDEVFVLSGTILEHRRKYIINYLKNAVNRKKKILLITTQVVEAGVDIDMDLGFKDRSLIDSEEQLAGRINRNVNKKDCVLYLFNYNRENIIYGKDKRYENTKNISKQEYLEILTTKQFDKIYNKVLAGIDKWNDTENAIGFDEYEFNIKKLRFQSTHFDFKLIDNDKENLTIFIPIAIPIEVPGIVSDSFEHVFSVNELKFLKSQNIQPNNDNKIEGTKVFELYLNLLEQRGDITSKKIADRVMQGILSKFLIQLIGSKKIKSEIIHWQDIEKSDKGYVYLTRWDEIYDEKFGIKDFKFESSETQFL